MISTFSRISTKRFSFSLTSTVFHEFLRLFPNFFIKIPPNTLFPDLPVSSHPVHTVITSFYHDFDKIFLCVMTIKFWFESSVMMQSSQMRFDAKQIY